MDFRGNGYAGECLDMFIAFYRQGRVDISGWEDLT